MCEDTSLYCTGAVLDAGGPVRGRYGARRTAPAVRPLLAQGVRERGGGGRRRKGGGGVRECSACLARSVAIFV